MKTLKRTEQKNVHVNTDMHSVSELRKLIEAGNIAVMDSSYNQLRLLDLDFMYDSFNALDEYKLIVFLEDTKEIKVVYNKNYGFYYTVVIMNDNSEISVRL